MVFANRLRAGKFAVALEITPPQRPLPEVLIRRARLLGERAHAINVIQRPDRQPSVDACGTLIGAGIEPVWHLVTRGRSRSAIAAEIATANASGIRQVLCIRGDHAGGDTSETPTLREAITMVAAAIPGGLIGATLNQYAADREAALRNLVPKLRAGASYVQTQPVFDVPHALGVVGAVLERAPDTKVVAMAMPLLSLEVAERIERRLGVTLPAAALRRIAAGGDAPWELFRETLAALADSREIAGVALMTFDMDPGAEVGERIGSCLPD